MDNTTYTNNISCNNGGEIRLFQLNYILNCHNGIVSIIGMHKASRNTGIPNGNNILWFAFFLIKNKIYIVIYIIFLIINDALCFAFPKYKTEDITLFFGLFYVSVMLSYIYQVRFLDGGLLLVC